MFALLLHETVDVVQSVKTSAVGVDEDEAVGSPSQLLDDRDISLIFYLVDKLVRAVLQEHHIVLRK